MNATKREIRNLECELSFREANAEEITQGTLGTIEGRAIVFNSPSEVLDEDGQLFKEIILPEAVTQEWLDSQDVKINLLHERTLTFGRVNKGDHTNAELIVDDEGVLMRVRVPNCDLGIRAREMVRTKVYTGMSFEFYPDEASLIIIREPGQLPLVEHKQFRYITAVTLGMDPAYAATTLNLRELMKKDEEKVEKETAAAETETTVEPEEETATETDNNEDTQAMAREMRRRVETLRKYRLG